MKTVGKEDRADAKDFVDEKEFDWTRGGKDFDEERKIILGSLKRIRLGDDDTYLIAIEDEIKERIRASPARNPLP